MIIGKIIIPLVEHRTKLLRSQELFYFSGFLVILLTMIYLAADKHGYKAIKCVEEYFQSKKMAFANFGVKNDKVDMTLEDMIPKVAKKVLENTNNTGILSCGTGVG